jgi:lipid-A-disaccharide synthase
LEQVGGELFLHRDRISFVGWSAPIRHLWRLWRDLHGFFRCAEAWRPDMVLLVDSPGWNRRVLAWAQARGLPVHWIAPPQAWAWKKRSLAYLKGVSVQPLFAFEVPYLQAFEAQAQWRGFPRAPVQPTRQDGGTTLALLPGTREVLWKRNLPLFADAARHVDGRAVVAVSERPSPALMQACRVRGLAWETVETLLRRASACLTVPGTGCLEAVRHGLPTVAAAHLGRLDLLLASRLLDSGSKVLPNRILGKMIVEEHYGDEADETTLAAALERARARRDDFVRTAEELEAALGPSAL